MTDLCDLLVEQTLGDDRREGDGWREANRGSSLQSKVKLRAPFMHAHCTIRNRIGEAVCAPKSTKIASIYACMFATFALTLCAA